MLAMRMLREYLIVECRNNSLTRTSGSHDKIAINTTFTYHRQLIEDLLLMWQYCVFAKHVRSNLRLSYLFQFFIEFVNASYSEILKVVTVPVNIERGESASIICGFSTFVTRMFHSSPSVCADLERLLEPI